MTKKLAHLSSNTAAWATNVGNESGQVLVCVLTTSEAAGLTPMARGLMRRYSNAEQAPPKLMYVDHDCCSGVTSALFPDWSDMAIRLDSHPLYSGFLSKLSACIFEWDAGDLAELKNAKEHLVDLSDDDVLRRLTRKELECHCRRRTRGTDTTTQYIQQLIDFWLRHHGGPPIRP